LRHIEVDRELKKTINIIKLRDSGFDPSARNFQVTTAGIVLGPGAPVARRPGAEPARAATRDEELPRSTRFASENAPYIVIVDDEFGLAELIAEVLAERGYATAIAINGELGLALLRERRPALVLLDLMMPVLDGSDMLKAMRSDPELATVPVVIMTALPEAVPTEDAASFEAVLQKPFTPDRLFEVVRASVGSAPVGQK
jgi:CheY-like chemotaxis protein